MLKDLTNEICDNGYCEVDSNFFTSKVEHNYDDEYYEDDWDDEVDDEYDEGNCDFNLEPFTPLQHQPTFPHFKEVSYSYADVRKNRFNVLISGMGKLSPEYVARFVTEISFDNNSVNVCFLCDKDLAFYLSDEARACGYGEYDIRGGCVRNRRNGEIVIEVLDPTGCVIMKHKFFNVMIESVNFDGFSYSEDDLQYIKVRFNYDHYVME